MALAGLMCALALAGTLAMSATAPRTLAWTNQEPQSKWAAPFPPKETIYRPECWLDEDASRYCSGDRNR